MCFFIASESFRSLCQFVKESPVAAVSVPGAEKHSKILRLTLIRLLTRASFFLGFKNGQGHALGPFVQSFGGLMRSLLKNCK